MLTCTFRLPGHSTEIIYNRLHQSRAGGQVVTKHFTTPDTVRTSVVDRLTIVAHKLSNIETILSYKDKLVVYKY